MHPQPATGAPAGYDFLVHQGHYQGPPQGLWGKFDHVRRSWENQVTRFAAHPAIDRLREHLDHRPLRVLDLGCGSGEGWDLLTSIPHSAKRQVLLEPGDLAIYHGVDLSPAMVEEARQRFAGERRARFDVLDLCAAERFLATEAPFDVHYSCYASLAHLADVDLGRLVGAVLGSQPGPLALVVDVYGRYSPEWPARWSEVGGLHPYNMLWVYPPAERAAHRAEFADYRVRYWGGAELAAFLQEAVATAGRRARITLTDRSLLVGRHLDTGEFNPQAKPLRRAVNGLFEFNRRTPAEDLLCDPLPRCTDAAVADFHARYIEAWNAAVHWFDRLLDGDRESAASGARLIEAGILPRELAPGLTALVAQRDAHTWMTPGDPVGNLLQPQFGLFLRQLEFASQRGLGCGHGLIAVVEVDPR